MLTTARGTASAPLELAIFTTMSMRGTVPPLPPDLNVESWTFRQNEFSLEDDAVVHKLFHRPGPRQTTITPILKPGGAGDPTTVPPHQISIHPQVVHKHFHVRNHFRPS